MLDTKKIDSDILEEIMALCEKAMIQPLSKKKPDEVVQIEEEIPEDGEHENDLGLDAGTHDEEHENPDDGDISDDDVEAMMEEYKQRKGR